MFLRRGLARVPFAGCLAVLLLLVAVQVLQETQGCPSGHSAGFALLAGSTRAEMFFPLCKAGAHDWNYYEGSSSVAVVNYMQPNTAQYEVQSVEC